MNNTLSSAYLQDAFAASFADQLNGWPKDFAPDNVWVLVDGALAGEDRMAQLRSTYEKPLAAFDETHLHAYEELGLFIWSLAEIREHDAAESLLTCLAGVPGLTFIATTAPLENVKHTLAWLAGARTTDNLRLYLRVGDSRVAEPALACLSEAQMVKVKKSIGAWAISDRTGQLKSLPLESKRPGEAVNDMAAGIVIDNFAYSRILSSAVPDMVYAELHQTDAKAFAAPQMSTVYQWLQTVIERARLMGVHQFPDQVEFARLARRALESFEQLPEMAATWTTLASGHSPLATLTQQWGNAQWLAIAPKAQREP